MQKSYLSYFSRLFLERSSKTLKKFGLNPHRFGLYYTFKPVLIKMKKLRWIFCSILFICVGCKDTAQPQSYLQSEVNTSIPELSQLTPAQILTKMRDHYKQELASVQNYALVTDEGLVVYVRKVAQGDSLKLESRTMNRPMPGQAEQIFRVNMYEVWNRGGFANMKNIDLLATAFSSNGTGVVDSVRCYKLRLDRRKLFDLSREGKALFDDNNTSGGNEVDMYIDPNNWMIRRIKGNVTRNGKSAVTTATWGNIINFKGFNVAQRRETLIDGLKFTAQEIGQINQLIENQKQQLLELKKGSLGIPQNQIEGAESVLTSDIDKMIRRVREMGEGRVSETVTIDEIHLNKELPKGLFGN